MASTVGSCPPPCTLSAHDVLDGDHVLLVFLFFCRPVSRFVETLRAFFQFWTFATAQFVQFLLCATFFSPPWGRPKHGYQKPPICDLSPRRPKVGTALMDFVRFKTSSGNANLGAGRNSSTMIRPYMFMQEVLSWSSSWRAQSAMAGVWWDTFGRQG